MPELPEVETICRELNHAGLIGATITSVKVFWPKVVENMSEKLFCQQLLNQQILNISRRGKYIVFSLTKDALMVHLRMTGKILISDSPRPQLKHEHLLIQLSNNKTLHYEDQRKFGRWTLTANPEEKLGKLGLEPFSESFTVEALQRMLKTRSTQMKPFLLNQQFIVGLGNIYVDEALWMSKIHPQRIASTLTKKEILELHQAIISVLTTGIDNSGTTLGTYRSNYFSISGKRGGNQHQLNVFRREGGPCPRCQTIIRKIKVAQRGTHFCPHCQPNP